MTFRLFAIGVTLLAGLVGLAALVADPELVPALATKLGEGGMWTALAVFLVAAALLGAWPRDAQGRLRTPSSRRR